MTLTLTFYLLLKKLNLGYIFWTKRDKAFIVQVCIPCGKTFLSIPKILTLWLWPWLFTCFWKNLTLAITFEPKVIGLQYYTYLFPVTRTLEWYQYFWPCGLDLDFDLLMEKLELVAAGGISPVRTDPDLVFAELWSLTLRNFTHFSLFSQLLLHPCMDLNETWQGCCTTSLEVRVGR